MKRQEAQSRMAAARKARRSPQAATAQQRRATLNTVGRTPRRWTRAELRLLGKLSDTEIGRRTGRFMASVRNKRIQLGIPRYEPKH